MSSNLANEPARVVEMFRTMLLIRAFEEAAGEAFHAGHVRGSVHQYIGEEAIAVGVCANLRDDDYLTSNHRGHGHSIAKGADPRAMMLELFGRVGGTSDGKGGSMHIADFSVGMLGANGVIADNCTMSVGAAQAIRLLGEDRIVVNFIGDGGINRGPFMEALNWAKVYDLPVLFMCENNQIAATTTTRLVTAGEGIAKRAESFDMPATTIDGNDLFEVDSTVARVVEEIRNGSGPQLIQAMTYRLRGHFAHDPAGYRDPTEVEAALGREPIARTEAWLRENGVGTDEIEALKSAVAGEIVGYVDEAMNADWPDGSLAFTDVQDIGAPSYPGAGQ
ncbi:MAG: thiamine pyrophosphate-dependent dehydrogenase E1 component subunit alpha [Alphaproteobacteria bacterium]